MRVSLTTSGATQVSIMASTAAKKFLTPAPMSVVSDSVAILKQITVVCSSNQNELIYKRVIPTGRARHAPTPSNTELQTR